jgi:hypothetical protein
VSIVEPLILRFTFWILVVVIEPCRNMNGKVEDKTPCSQRYSRGWLCFGMGWLAIMLKQNMEYEANNEILSYFCQKYFKSVKMTVTVNLTKKLRLSQALKKAGIDNPTSVTKLIISGEMNDDDFLYIKNLAKLNTLEELDLEKVKEESCRFMDFFNLSGNLSEVTLPGSFTDYISNSKGWQICQIDDDLDDDEPADEFLNFEQVENDNFFYWN